MTLDTVTLPQKLKYYGYKPFDGCEKLPQEALKIIEEYEQNSNR
jgi:hypothetical protein